MIIIIYLFSLISLSSIFGKNIFWGFKDKIKKESGIEDKIISDLLQTKEFLPVITYPTHGSTVALPVNIKGYISSEIDYIELKLDNGIWNKINNKPNWFFTLTSISTGYHAIYIHSVEKDIKGPDISISFYTYYLPEKPVINFPIDGTWVKSPITNTGTASDKVDSVEVKLDSGIWNTVNGIQNWYYVFNTVSTGAHAIFARTKTKLGISDEISVNFIVYNNSPSIPIMTITNNSYNVDIYKI